MQSWKKICTHLVIVGLRWLELELVQKLSLLTTLSGIGLTTWKYCSYCFKNAMHHIIINRLYKFTFVYFVTSKYSMYMYMYMCRRLLHRREDFWLNIFTTACSSAYGKKDTMKAYLFLLSSADSQTQLHLLFHSLCRQSSELKQEKF